MALWLKKIFDRIENLPIGWRGIFLIANAVIFLRVLLEGIFDIGTIFSYWTLIYLGSWFFSIFISFILLVSFIAGIQPIKSARLLIAGLPIIFLPLVPFFFGRTQYFEFPHGTWGEVFSQIITIFAMSPNLGIFFTIEISTVVVAIFVYFISRVSFWRSLAGLIGSCAVFSFFALQGKIFGYTSNPISGDPLFALASNFSTTQYHMGINFFIFLIVLCFLFYKISPKKARALFFQVRPERLISFAIFAVLCFLGARESDSFYFFNFLLGFSLFIFFLFYAAVSNDVADLAIDKISNPNRPYAKGIFTPKEMKILQGVILGIIIILVLIIDSMPILILTAINVGLSVLYSVFRFRKFLFSHMIAALGESTVILYGYFVQAPTSSSAPMETWILFFAVFVFFALFLPAKDLKDFAGDKKEKVRNFLTVFGWQKGKIITAISVFFAFIFFAFIMGSPLFFALSFIFAGLGAYFVVYYERVGEKPSYINFLAFILLFSAFSFAF